MTKQSIRLIIPLLIIGGLLIYSWLRILSTDIIATWQNYLALVLFVVLIFLFIKNFRIAIMATGLYLLLSAFAVLSLTPEINTSWINIASIETPHVNLLSLGLGVLFLILNLDQLIDIYLDYKAGRTKIKD